MDRRLKPILQWPYVLLAPLLIPLLLITVVVFLPVALGRGLLQRLGWLKPDEPIELRPEELAGYLRDLIEGKGNDWDWDDFENMKLKDPVLDSIRHEACMAGPPHADIAKLQACLAKAEALRTQPMITT